MNYRNAAGCGVVVGSVRVRRKVRMLLMRKRIMPKITASARAPECLGRCSSVVEGWV
ncbi:hypothetical protein M758_UG210000 [Ceratodon purpureus]|nr:hypothetical protein M758_UG210000 [Ceratodon purpureus]